MIVLWPVPPTATTREPGSSAAVALAASSGVRRSRVPLSSSAGTDGSGPRGGAHGRRGQTPVRGPVLQRGVRVEGVEGRLAQGGDGAGGLGFPRPTGVDGDQGNARSVQVVVSSRATLNARGSVGSSTALAIRCSRNSGPASPGGAERRAPGNWEKIGDGPRSPVISRPSRSDRSSRAALRPPSGATEKPNSGPPWRICATSWRRSPTGSGLMWAHTGAHSIGSTRRLAAMVSRISGSGPPGATTESSARRATLPGCAARSHANFVP